jgi:hypothetical protein
MSAKKESVNTEITRLTKQLSELTAEIKRLNTLVDVLQQRLKFAAESRRRMDTLNVELLSEAAKLRRNLAEKDAENRP